MATKYPIVLVHGLLSFKEILGFPLFYGVQDKLIKAGNTTFMPTLSANGSNETRGEQLIQEIGKIMRKTGAKKVNLIGHSQGPLTCRYVASTYPKQIASVTSVSGANHGSEFADLLEKIFSGNEVAQDIATVVLDLVGKLLSSLSGKPERPQDFRAAFKEITTEGVADFNLKYPQGLPADWGGEGNYIVNGIHYFSWSGIISNNIIEQGPNALDLSHIALAGLSMFFSREKENDGLVGRYSSHLGQVIRSDYSMDHLDAINQIAGITPLPTKPIRMFLEHAKRLEGLGL